MRKGTEKAISLIAKQKDIFAKMKEELINKEDQLEIYAERLDSADELLRKIKHALESAGLAVHPFFKEINNQITSHMLQSNGNAYESSFSDKKTSHKQNENNI